MSVDVEWFRPGREPWVVGTSTQNALASTPYQTWAFHRAEATGFVGSPFRLPNGNPVTFGRVRTLDPRLTGDERRVALAARALDGIGGLLSRVPPQARFGVALCLPEQHEGSPSDTRGRYLRRRIESAIVRPFVERGYDIIARPLEIGHSAMGQGCLEVGRMLARRDLDVALILGVDSHYDPLRLERLFEQERVLDTDWRESFVPGEAASAVLLARPDVARQLGLEAVAYLRAAGVGYEVATAGNDVGLLGQGLSRPAVRIAKELAAEQGTIDWWISDATGEPLRIQELQLAWPRAIRIAGSPTGVLDLLPSAFGELGAASMPTGAVLAIEGLRRGAPSGRNALITGSSDGGARGVVLFRAEVEHA